MTWSRVVAVEEVRHFISKQKTITFAGRLNVGLRASERELDRYGGVKNGSKVFSLSKQCNDIVFTEIGKNEIRAELGRREE